jgi:hypothetical protein
MASEIELIVDQISPDSKKKESKTSKNPKDYFKVDVAAQQMTCLLCERSNDKKKEANCSNGNHATRAATHNI